MFIENDVFFITNIINNIIFPDVKILSPISGILAEIVLQNLK